MKTKIEESLELSEIIKEYGKVWLVSGWQRWFYASILFYINLKLFLTKNEYTLIVLFLCIAIIITCILVEHNRYSKWFIMFERYISLLAVTKFEVEDYIVLNNTYPDEFKIKSTYISNDVRYETFEYAKVSKEVGIEKPYFSYVYLDDTNSTETIRGHFITRKLNNVLHIPIKNNIKTNYRGENK